MKSSPSASIRRSPLYLFFVFISLAALAAADTGPYYAGDPFGGGPDFTCDDNPCDPSCSDTSEEPTDGVLALSNGLTNTWDQPELRREPLPYPGSCQEKAPPQCGLTRSKKAFDKCVWSGEGPDCGESQAGDKKCCDHPVVNGVADKSDCTCSGVRLKSGERSRSDNQKCADCMCLAEMSGESQACMKLMYCILRFDAKDKNPRDPELGLCEAAVGPSPGNPNSWRFSSGRCRCDRSQGKGDDRGVNGLGKPGFNQAYCDCLDGKISKRQQEVVKACKAARQAVDCRSVPWDHYAVGTDESACPCRADRVKATKQCGTHIFCDCV